MSWVGKRLYCVCKDVQTTLSGQTKMEIRDTCLRSAFRMHLPNEALETHKWPLLFNPQVRGDSCLQLCEGNIRSSWQCSSYLLRIRISSWTAVLLWFLINECDNNVPIHWGAHNISKEYILNGTPTNSPWPINKTMIIVDLFTDTNFWPYNYVI